MDELDDDLFGTSSRRKNLDNHDSSKFNQQRNIGIKKKVVAFHDFNEDDPLADLLSDDEDFETNPAPSTAHIKGSFVSDLFGIRTTDSKETNAGQLKLPLKSNSILENVPEIAGKSIAKSEDWIGAPKASPKKILEETPKPRAPQRSHMPNDGLGSGTADKSKKSSLMEDLFGTRPKSDTSKDKIIPKDPVFSGLEMSEVQRKSEQLSKSNITGYAPSLSAPRESRRSRSSGGIVDPLGMFSSPTVAPAISGVQNFEANLSKPDYLGSSKFIDGATGIKEGGKTVEVPKEDLPEWLGGPKKTVESSIPRAKKDIPPEVPLDASFTSTNLPEETKNEALEGSGYALSYAEQLSTLTGAQFDQQATMMSLQQQEHELRTAATLSRQSEQLNKMIESQRNRLNDQGKQFNVLIKRQIDRQELLEAQMKAQQDRINSHLQVLLAQPTSVPIASSIIESKDLSKEDDKEKRNLIEFESIIEKLETEKICFENILDRLKDQHVKEISIIEESYTRQIEMMSQGMERLEKRLRQDAELAEADYEAKIQKMREEEEILKISHGEEVDNLKKEHVKQIQDIRDQQRRNIELVKNEYIETIENISKAKEIERHTISNATTQTTSLNETLEIIKVTMNEIGQLKTELENNKKESNKEKEIILKQQIEEIKDLKECLNKQHETLETDCKDMADAARRIDGGALRLISEFDRQVQEIVEAGNRLKSREEALLRDKESLNAQMQWERNHIQAMKETWIKEQERQAKQLSEERNTIAAERSRLETLQRLKLDDNDTAKAELEAALSTARDAANLASKERQKWRERLNELEIEKQKIKEKENSLTLRAKELEDLTQSALEKREEGLRALRQAHYLEEQHKTYISQLQIQSQALAERENKIASDKLALARERLALRIGQTDKPEKDTAKLSGLVNYVDEELHSHHPSQFNDLHDSQMTTTHFKDIVDPHLVLLKLGLNDELDVTNDCLGTMQSIIQ